MLLCFGVSPSLVSLTNILVSGSGFQVRWGTCLARHIILSNCVARNQTFTKLLVPQIPFNSLSLSWYIDRIECNPIFTCYESILTLGHKSVFTRGRKSNFPAARPGLTRSRLEGQEVWRLLRRLYTSQSIFQARDSGFECRVVTWRIKAPALITALTWKPAQESWRQFHLILHTFCICICICVYKEAR